MHLPSKSSRSHRLFTVLAVVLALPLVALAPAFLVSTFFTQPSVNTGESVPLLQDNRHPDPEAAETVLVTMVATYDEVDSDPSSGEWHLLEDADIIKITIEDRGIEVRPDDVATSGQLADPQWFTANIIRDGAEIPEDLVRHGDILTFSFVDGPPMENLPEDRSDCATILSIRTEDTDGDGPETYVGYIKVTGDDSATMGTCSAFWIDTDHE